MMVHTLRASFITQVIVLTVRWVSTLISKSNSEIGGYTTYSTVVNANYQLSSCGYIRYSCKIGRFQQDYKLRHLEPQSGGDWSITYMYKKHTKNNSPRVVNMFYTNQLCTVKRFKKDRGFLSTLSFFFPLFFSLFPCSVLYCSVPVRVPWLRIHSCSAPAH